MPLIFVAIEISHVSMLIIFALIEVVREEVGHGCQGGHEIWHCEAVVAGPNVSIEQLVKVFQPSISRVEQQNISQNGHLFARD